MNLGSVQGRAHVLAANEAAFEDGTINYLSIPAVEIGLRYLEFVGIENIGERVRCLTGWLLDELLALRQQQQQRHGPHLRTRHDRCAWWHPDHKLPDGHLLDYRRVGEFANQENISLRTGCFCNPGTGEIAEGLTEDDMRARDGS